MAAKKSTPVTPVPTRTSDTSKTIKKDTAITSTRTDADPTHKADPTPAGSPPPGTDVHDDEVDAVLAGITTSRSSAINRAASGQAAPDDDPTGGRAKGGASSVEQASGGTGVDPTIDNAVRSSKVGQIGTELGTGGITGPGRDGIQGALNELRDLNSTTVTTPSGGTKSTSLDETKRDVHIESKDHKIKVDHLAGDPTSSDPEKRPRTIVEDDHNHTITTVDDVTGATKTNDQKTNRPIDHTDALQDPPKKGDKALPGAPVAGEAEPPVPADEDDGPGDADDADAAPANDSDDDQTPVGGDGDDGDDDQTPVGGDDPDHEQSFGDVDNSAAPSGPDDQSLGDVDNSAAPDNDGQSTELDPDGQSVGTVDNSAAPDEDDGDGQTTEDDDPDGQSVGTVDNSAAPDDDGQSTEDDGGETSIPVSDDGSPPVTLPPDISAAIQADVAKIRSLKPQTGNGFTDPGPDDDGAQADTRVTAVPDVHNEILGGDDFNRDDDAPHASGDAPVPTGPADNGFTDPGPDDDQPVQTSGREQDPFDRGPDLKPIESKTTSGSTSSGADTDDDDDDDGTVGSPLVATSVVRQFQFDRVPAIADGDDDPDDD